MQHGTVQNARDDYRIFVKRSLGRDVLSSPRYVFKDGAGWHVLSVHYLMSVGGGNPSPEESHTGRLASIGTPP